MKKYIYIVILVISSVLTLVFYYEGKLQVITEKSFYSEGESELLKDRLLFQINTPKVQLSSDFAITDMNRAKVCATQITRGNRLGIYIDKVQCQSCWEDDLRYLIKQTKNKKQFEKPFILAGGYNLRELKLFISQQKITLPVYLIDINKHPEIKCFTQYCEPFYFTLDTTRNMSSVFFSSDKVKVLLGGMYFDYVFKKCTVATIVKESLKDSSSTIKAKGLVAINPVVALGKVHFRKRFEVEFRIKNMGSKPCIISDLSTSCTCVILKSNPRIVLPNETAVIKISVITTTKGYFDKHVRFRTNLERLPFDLIVSGEVI